MGEGKNPTKNHLLKLADIVGINQSKALEIIQQVLAAIEKWGYFANESGVSQSQNHNISKTLNSICKDFKT